MSKEIRIVEPSMFFPYKSIRNYPEVKQKRIEVEQRLKEIQDQCIILEQQQHIEQQTARRERKVAAILKNQSIFNNQQETQTSQLEREKERVTDEAKNFEKQLKQAQEGKDKSTAEIAKQQQITNNIFTLLEQYNSEHNIINENNNLQTDVEMAGFLEYAMHQNNLDL